MRFADLFALDRQAGEEADDPLFYETRDTPPISSCLLTPITLRPEKSGLFLFALSCGMHRDMVKTEGFRSLFLMVTPTGGKLWNLKAAATEESETFEVIAREWHAKFSSSWVPSHSGKIIRRLELYIFPWLGTRPIKELTASELLSAL